jgi:hypothetical protein
MPLPPKKLDLLESVKRGLGSKILDLKKNLDSPRSPEYDFLNLDLRRFQVNRLLDPVPSQPAPGKEVTGESGQQHEVIRLTKNNH